MMNDNNRDLHFEQNKPVFRECDLASMMSTTNNVTNYKFQWDKYCKVMQWWNGARWHFLSTFSTTKNNLNGGQQPSIFEWKWAYCY